MTHPVQFDIRSLLVWTAMIAVLFAAWRIGGNATMYLSSLCLGVILFAVSVARGSRPLFFMAIALTLFHLLASLVHVRE